LAPKIRRYYLPRIDLSRELPDAIMCTVPRFWTFRVVRTAWKIEAEPKYLVFKLAPPLYKRG
jgi:hypothetical protein